MRICLIQQYTLPLKNPKPLLQEPAPPAPAGQISFLIWNILNFLNKAWPLYGNKKNLQVTWWDLYPYIVLFVHCKKIIWIWSLESTKKNSIKWENSQTTHTVNGHLRVRIEDTSSGARHGEEKSLGITTKTKKMEKKYIFFPSTRGKGILIMIWVVIWGWRSYRKLSNKPG